ncbi:MAG TPA: elongation factor G [Anaerolineae bacterium]|nr:elongation factor G [Anaerolineae bacterium]
MRQYSKIEELRNLVLLGHGSSGKTSLAEAMLFDAGAISRLGRIEDKSTASDYEEEEHTRGLSVSCSVLPCEWQGHKVNILDVPGYIDFMGEVKGAIRAADAGILVVCAASGVEVGAELHWGFLDEATIPRLVFVNKIDRDNASFARTLEQLSARFGKTFVPIQLPIGAGASFAGVIDLLSMKACLAPDGTEADIPADLLPEAEQTRREMMEYAAESDDDLMMKYLDGEELTIDEMRTALRLGSLRGEYVLALAGSATQNIGVKQLLDAVVSFLPDPAGVERKAINEASQEEELLSANPAAPLVAQVFKTTADPFVGKLTYYRVYSGTLASDSRVLNINHNEQERLGQLFMVRGKEQTPIPSVQAGDIGAATRLSATGTGDTLCDRDAPYRLPAIVYPEPLYSVAVFPKTKTDLDKLSGGLTRLVDEDPTLRVERNAETKETLLSGMGESHIQIAARHLASKFGVAIDMDVPRIAYRETITKTTSAQGRHKKQTGGRGQFGDVYCRFEPLSRGAGFEFDSEIFGGSVPRQYVPAVEKGIREILQSGVIAGYPTVDFRCVIYDGSYHSVDSSEISFRLAAHIAFRSAIPNGGPVLLEPIMDVAITVPEDAMGDILGDLNTRRGRVSGMDQEHGAGVIAAQVPLAEMQRYSTDLRSMTQGRGYYTMTFSRYDIVPAHLVEIIAQEAKARRDR